MEKYPHVNKANKYAREVVRAKIPACKWVKLACQRHLDDLAREKSGPFYFDKQAAETFCDFAEKMPHVKGEWAKRHELFVLEPWMCFVWGNVFGWKRKKDGLRRFREVFLEVPRKNGKSSQAALVGHYMLSKDGEAGSEVYSGATTEKQAWEVFGPARIMALKADGYKEHFDITVNAKNLAILNDNSKFEPIIGKPGDGSSPHCAIIDEYHEHDTAAQYDSMLTGMGARSQPLLIVTTTAGVNLAGPCYDKRDQVCKMLEGTISSDELFGIIYTIDETDAWDKWESWVKANPNLGVSVSEDFLRARLQEATQRASRQNIIRCKHLNQWMQARVAWMNMLAWDACRDVKLDIEQFKGEPCWIAIDAASRSDIMPVLRMFKRGEDYYIFCQHWIPEEAAEGADKTHYQGWVKDGWLQTTPGNITDYEYIEDDLIATRGDYQIVECIYDPFHMTEMATRLSNEGFPMTEFGMTVKNFSEPMKAVEAAVLTKRIHHNGDPALRWQISNVVARTDAKDNIFPRKEFPQNKIDAAVTLIAAFARAQNQVVRRSIYEDRGFELGAVN